MGLVVIWKRFSFICIILFAALWKLDFFKETALYFYLFHTALASTVQTHVPVTVIMWYCRHLSSLLVEGQALWCSLVNVPVSAVQIVTERWWELQLWETVMSATMCIPWQWWHPASPTFVKGPNEVITVPETEVTLTFDPHPSPCCNVNSSSRHLPRGVPTLLPSLAGGMPSCHTSGQRVWKSRWADVF